MPLADAIVPAIASLMFWTASLALFFLQEGAIVLRLISADQLIVCTLALVREEELVIHEVRMLGPQAARIGMWRQERRRCAWSRVCRHVLR
jgi:hypothetical protein